MGFEAGSLVWCRVYGFGLSEVFARHLAAYIALKWAGTAYVVYLACHFVWTYGGQLIFGRIQSPCAVQLRGGGVSMLVVAGFKALS